MSETSPRYESSRRELPPGAMTKTRLMGVLLGLLLALALVAVMTLIVIASKAGNGYGGYGGCCAGGCCNVQTACCTQPQCRPSTRIPQALDRQPRATPEMDIRGRPLPDAHLWQPAPDTQAGYTPPCACVPSPLVPWWPDWRGKDNATSVPEPGTLALVGLGGLLLWKIV